MSGDFVKWLLLIAIVIHLGVSQLLAEFQSSHNIQCCFFLANFI